MPSVMQLTPMEERVLSTMEDYCRVHDITDFAYMRMTAHTIAQYGVGDFGPDWHGKVVYFIGGRQRYPVLNRFLGRLIKKGLVERVERTSGPTGNWGYWRLTEQSRDFLGLAS